MIYSQLFFQSANAKVSNKMPPISSPPPPFIHLTQKIKNDLQVCDEELENFGDYDLLGCDTQKRGRREVVFFSGCETQTLWLGRWRVEIKNFSPTRDVDVDVHWRGVVCERQ